MFCTKNGTALSAGNVRRDFRKILKEAGLVDTEWTPREMRHSFVSLLSDSGVPIEHISRLVGHANTVVTEGVPGEHVLPGDLALLDLRNAALGDPHALRNRIVRRVARFPEPPDPLVPGPGRRRQKSSKLQMSTVMPRWTLSGVMTLKTT